MIKSKCKKRIQTPISFGFGNDDDKIPTKAFLSCSQSSVAELIGGQSQSTLSVSMLFMEGEKRVGGWWPLWPLFQIILVRWHGISSLPHVKPINLQPSDLEIWTVYWFVNIWYPFHQLCKLCGPELNFWAQLCPKHNSPKLIWGE